MPGIVVGIDGSEHSRRALRWAVREAALRQAALTVLTVNRAVSGTSPATPSLTRATRTSPGPPAMPRARRR